MKNIIWISSYPKSGNTMLRLFLSGYLFTKEGIIDDLKIAKAISKFNTQRVYKYLGNKLNVEKINLNPNLISNHFIDVQLKLYKNFPKNTFFFKTHNAFSNYNMQNFTNNKITRDVIYIVRDPRDVLLSQMHHYNFDTQKISLEYILNETRFSYGSLKKQTFPEIISSWKNHFNSWYDFIKQNNIGIIVRYEDIVSNPEINFMNILKYLLKEGKSSINQEKFANTLKSINIQNLKKIEIRDGFDERTSQDELFFRSGKVNQWRNIIQPEIRKILEQQLKDEMKLLKYL
jgi:hypothetical protein